MRPSACFLSVSLRLPTTGPRRPARRGSKQAAERHSADARHRGRAGHFSKWFLHDLVIVEGDRPPAQQELQQITQHSAPTHDRDHGRTRQHHHRPPAWPRAEAGFVQLVSLGAASRRCHPHRPARATRSLPLFTPPAGRPHRFRKRRHRPLRRRSLPGERPNCLGFSIDDLSAHRLVTPMKSSVASKLLATHWVAVTSRVAFGVRTEMLAEVRR